MDGCETRVRPSINLNERWSVPWVVPVWEGAVLVFHPSAHWRGLFVVWRQSGPSQQKLDGKKDKKDKKDQGRSGQ